MVSYTIHPWDHPTTWSWGLTFTRLATSLLHGQVLRSKLCTRQPLQRLTDGFATKDVSFVEVEMGSLEHWLLVNSLPWLLGSWWNDTSYPLELCWLEVSNRKNICFFNWDHHHKHVWNIVKWKRYIETIYETKNYGPGTGVQPCTHASSSVSSRKGRFGLF